jgi:YVTN family beta-propeller protein
MGARKAALAVVAGLLLSGTAAGAAHAETVSDALPLHGDVVAALVDQAHGQAADQAVVASSSDVVFADATGTVLKDLTATDLGATGVTALALGPDGTTLYVALGAAGTIDAVDTATHTVTATYPTGDGHAPRGLAVTAGRVWFSYATADGGGGLASLDPAHPGAAPVPALTTTAPGAALAASPAAAPGVLVASFTGAGTGTYDVAGDGTATATGAHTGTAQSGMSITPDGKDLVTSTDVLSLADLSRDVFAYPVYYLNQDGVVAPDGTLGFTSAVYTSDTEDTVSVARSWESVMRHYPAVAGQILRTVGWSADSRTLFALGDIGGTYRLHAFTDAGVAETTLTTAGATALPGQAFDVAVTLTTAVPLPSGATLTAVRAATSGAPAETFSGVTLTQQIHYPITWDPYVYTAVLHQGAGLPEGSYDYTLSYAGDSGHGSASSVAEGTLARHADALTLKAPATGTMGGKVTVTGTLDSPPTPGGTVVHIAKSNAAHGATHLTDATVKADGTFSFTDHLLTGGANHYTATTDGDLTHAPAKATAAISAVKHATSLSVTTNHTTFGHDDTATVTVHLGTTHTGRTVTLYAAPKGESKKRIAAGKVSKSGTLTAHEKLTRNTTFTATFAGDSWYASASATKAVKTHLAISAKLEDYAGSTTIGAHIYRIYARGEIDFEFSATPVPHGCDNGYVTVQHYYDGAWHGKQLVPDYILCPGQDNGYLRLPNNLADHGHYRIRVSAPDPTWGTSTTTGWHYFTVRR